MKYLLVNVTKGERRGRLLHDSSQSTTQGRRMSSREGRLPFHDEEAVGALHLDFPLQDFAGHHTATPSVKGVEGLQGSHEACPFAIRGPVPAIVHDGLLSPLSLEEVCKGRPLE